MKFLNEGLNIKEVSSVEKQRMNLRAEDIVKANTKKLIEFMDFVKGDVRDKLAKSLDLDPIDDNVAFINEKLKPFDELCEKLKKMVRERGLKEAKILKEFKSKDAAIDFLIEDEMEAIRGYNKVLEDNHEDFSEAERELLEHIIKDEEEHIRELESIKAGKPMMEGLDNSENKIEVIESVDESLMDTLQFKGVDAVALEIQNRNGIKDGGMSPENTIELDYSKAKVIKCLEEAYKKPVMENLEDDARLDMDDELYSLTKGFVRKWVKKGATYRELVSAWEFVLMHQEPEIEEMMESNTSKSNLEEGRTIPTYVQVGDAVSNTVCVYRITSAKNDGEALEKAKDLFMQAYDLTVINSNEIPSNVPLLDENNDEIEHESLKEDNNQVEDKLDKAYKGSWFTIEGAGGDLNEWKTGIQDLLDKENIGKIKEWIDFTGKEMNDKYHLTGNNAYPDDLHFLAFSLDGLNVGKLAIFKLRFGARWFDDVCDNNADREGRQHE